MCGRRGSLRDKVALRTVVGTNKARSPASDLVFVRRSTGPKRRKDRRRERPANTTSVPYRTDGHGCVEVFGFRLKKTITCGGPRRCHQKCTTAPPFVYPPTTPVSVPNRIPRTGYAFSKSAFVRTAVTPSINN